MSDDIPFEIQVEIIKRIPVKSLIQFRSVSKTWKSLIDSSDFIAHYSCQDTELQHLLVRNVVSADCVRNYASIIDDDTFPQQKVYLTPPHLVSMLKYFQIIGSSHGLLCLYGCVVLFTPMAVLWNISIRKAVAVFVPNAGYRTILGFGVCGKTTDPKIVMIDTSCIPQQVKVFTLSTRAWRRPYGNLPLKSVQFDFSYLQVTVGGCPYWLATDEITLNGELTFYRLIISFDMISEEFRDVKLPDSLAYQDDFSLSMSKLKESLVVLESVGEANGLSISVWMMEAGVSNSFTKLFTFNVNTPVAAVRGFRKSGEPIIEIREDDRRSHKLVVYEPYSKHIDNLGIDGIGCSFLVRPYKETLLLHDY